MRQFKLDRLKIKVVALFVATVMLSISLVSATYAWLEISRTPIVTDLELTVLTDSNLEVALDENGSPGEWDVSLDLSNLLEDVAPLRPVTFSKKNQALYTTLYDLDGRKTGKAVALSDAVNANVKVTGNSLAYQNGYYIAVSFWVRGGQNATISLANAMTVKEGVAGSGTYVIGKPLWDEDTQTHQNGGNGLETAIRFGFRCQTTDSNGRPIDNTRFIVYEPNCDTHVTAPDGYLDTTGLDGGLLADAADRIRQTTSKWNETAPALSNEVIYSLGEFQDSPNLFKLKIGDMQKVTMYVWLEGRDIDCINVASAARTGILGRIQLTANGGYPDTGIGRD